MKVKEYIENIEISNYVTIILNDKVVAQGYLNLISLNNIYNYGDREILKVTECAKHKLLTIK